MSNTDPLTALNDKMDTLIKIQAALAIKGMGSQKEKVAFLYGAGLGPTFIANLLGVSANSISSTMAKQKKSAGPKGAGSDE